MSITETLFEANVAEYKGGAIDWDVIEPKMYRNSMKNNKAFVYANDIGAIPQRIIMIT